MPTISAVSRPKARSSRRFASGNRRPGALRAGIALRSRGHHPPDGEVIRIQVKSGRVRDGCIRFNTCSTDHGKGRQPYRGLADLIAVHIPEPDRIFMVPVDDCPSCLGVLALEPTRNNQRRRIRLAADYGFESWVRALSAGLD